MDFPLTIFNAVSRGRNPLQVLAFSGRSVYSLTFWLPSMRPLPVLM